MHAGDKPMRHVNVPRTVLDAARKLLTARPSIVLGFGLVLYIVLTVVCAFLFFAAGPDCYLGVSGAFSFLPMLFLSLHTISTVGYGSVAPSYVCIGPHVVLLIESYLSIIVTAGIGGYVFA